MRPVDAILSRLAHCEVLDRPPAYVGRMLWCTPILRDGTVPSVRALNVQPRTVYVEELPVRHSIRYVVWDCDGRGTGVFDPAWVEHFERQYMRGRVSRS